MKLLTTIMLLAAPLTSTVVAQERAQPVRRTVELAFMTRLRHDLGLDQAAGDRVSAVLTDWGRTRQALEVEERQLRMALRQQLRPGVAGDADSVSTLINHLLGNRVRYAESFQGEMRALEPILSPVQRGQYLLLRDEILQRVRQIQMERQVDGVPTRVLQERRNRP